MPSLRQLMMCLLLALGAGSTCVAGDELVTSARHADGTPIHYVLTAETAEPEFVVILMPGGAGVVSPEMRDGRLAMGGRGNFLIRSRALFAGSDFAAVSTDATDSPERMLGIVQDLARRYPQARIYVIGTSRSTLSTMRLASRIDGQVAGFVHSSSMSSIAAFDPRGLKSRHLLVHHRYDHCRVTGYASAVYAHEKTGVELLTMEGGVAEGDPCEARGHHGYNGIERETVAAIKAWIRR